MRADSPGSWSDRQPYQSEFSNSSAHQFSHQQEQQAQWTDYQEPVTPTYASPRLAPKPPGYLDHRHQHQQSPPLPSSSGNSRSVGPRPSKNSLRSLTTSFFGSRQSKTPSAISTDSDSIVSHPPPSDSTTHLPAHPFNGMRSAPLPVVSSHDATEDEEDCPVCLEPLSFSFRLPGEKPHIVPECGHALHEACFTAVYGPPPSATGGHGHGRAAVLPRKANLGVCGVCRRPMKVGDGDGGKSNKLAALTGMGERNTPALYPGRDNSGQSTAHSPTSTFSSGSNHGTLGAGGSTVNVSSRKRNGTTSSRPQEPTDDDPIDYQRSHAQDSTGSAQYIVSPSISIRPEFSSLTRTQDQTQPLTCIVVLELPAKRGLSNIPGQVQDFNPPRPRTYENQQQQQQVESNRISRNGYAPSSNGDANSFTGSLHGSSEGHPHPPARAISPAPSYLTQQSSAFAAITADLKARIIDWKGHPLSDLGPLQMYDLLSVRRDSLVREFSVYLFREALICVVEEKKRTLGRLLSEGSGGNSHHSGSSHSNKGVLRLKGRIYVRHIKQVIASSAAGEMSLTIDMEDELASFILIYRERETLDAWKTRIEALVQSFHGKHLSPQPSEAPSGYDLEEFGGSSKAMRMLSGGTANTRTTGSSANTGQDSLLGASHSSRSSTTSHSSYMAQHRSQGAINPKLGGIGEDDEMSSYDPGNLVQPHISSGPSNSLPPLPHPPIDLILVVSVPAPNASPSTAALKIRVIKATLDFLVSSLGKGDRISFVTFEVGPGGRVRKTPFLSPHSSVNSGRGKERLDMFIDDIGSRPDSEAAMNDEFLVRANRDEKTDVVTAVNHGLDIVLQRKAKNPIGAMLLVSDAADSTRRAQMDLVLARAEAGNVPIHSFGYGRSHDPASLWLMSNHTSGTYTFVKDWYELRQCVAGCVGGMMSVGIASMKLHMKVVDGARFRIRKVSGGPTSILSTDGQHVDVEVGELRYGERKEMLIELELDNTDMQAKIAAQRRLAHGGHGGRSLNATDQFVQSMGLDSLAISDEPSDFMDGMMDRMIDEVPVVEVDGSFFDPAAARSISRLAHPVLLTVTLLPPSPTNAMKASNSSSVSDPVIVRRRMELLASDMITRGLVLVSRKNFPQAQKILGETKRILHTVLQTISRSLPPPNSNGGTVRNRKEILTLAAVRAMQAMLQDLQILSDALDDNVELFAHDQRNFGAQQAMILRDQKSWSGRSATERLFWTIDNSIELVARSTDWVPRE